MNSYIIRTARPDEAAAIATLIMEAMNHDCCQWFAGPDHTLDDFHLLMTELVRRTDSQYSYLHTQVAVVDQEVMKMRGGAKTQNETSHYKLGKYTLDANHATLRNDDTGASQTITQREAQILQLLAENKNNVVRREAILSRFWNTEDDYFASRSLDVFINKLRKVLADEPKINLKTVRGIGLQLLVEA